MRFKQNAPVTTQEGSDIGHIDRVVLDPKTREVTHVVVRKGLVLTEDKVVPVDLIESAADDKVAIRGAASDVEALPPFEEKHFVQAETGPTGSAPGDAPALNWYSPMGPLPPMGWAGPTALPPVETERNIPEGTVPLKTGAKVIAADGKKVGLVEGVITASPQDRATDILVARGGLLRKKTKKLLPIGWVKEVREGGVYLTVASSAVEELEAIAE
ncbi:MAG: PRC-barrel domain-containing protein [Anaerolineales bacterium]